MSIKFPKLSKEILKPLPKNEYPVLNTFLFVSCWIGFALDKSMVSMRDLCMRMNLQGINVQISTFSKASKMREIEVFEKIVAKLNKRLSIKKGIDKARALFPIDSTVISLTSKLLWQEKWHQVKLFCGLNSITSEVGGIQHFWLFNVSPIFFHPTLTQFLSLNKVSRNSSIITKINNRWL